MLSRILLGVRCTQSAVFSQLKRNFGVTAVVAQKTDPIQQLFLDKVHEYAKKSKTAGGKLVDATPVEEKALSERLVRLEAVYGATGVDFSKFPAFTFEDPTLEAVGVNVDISDVAAKTVDEEEAAEDPNKPFWLI